MSEGADKIKRWEGKSRESDFGEKLTKGVHIDHKMVEEGLAKCERRDLLIGRSQIKRATKKCKLYLQRS